MATAEVDLPLPRERGVVAERLVGTASSSLVLGILLALLAWPLTPIVPTAGLDSSWVAGLYMAHDAGLQFGRDLIFTYGPLGFLEMPALYDPSMWALAFAYQLAIHCGVAISLVWAVRRSLPLPLAVAAAYCLLAAGRLAAAAVLLAFIWAMVAMEAEAPVRTRELALCAGGVLAAFELLGKANFGITVLALVATAAIALPHRRRRLPRLALTFLVAVGALWLLVGQDLRLLPQFAEHVLELVSGYSEAMGSNTPVIGWQLPVALGCIALLLLGSVLATRGEPRRGRLAVPGLVALYSFACFKQGFVRQGYENTPEFFVLIAAAGLLLAARMDGRWRYAGVLGLAMPLLAIALIAAPRRTVWEPLQPRRHVEAFRQSARALASPAYRDRLVAEARSSMRSDYDLDRATLRALGSRSLHVDPWEIALAWAYGLNWHPLPVMQSYAAYTPALDRMNAEALRDDSGPEAILRRHLQASGAAADAINGRYPGWESPASMRAMLCDYRAVRTTTAFQLLVRTPERCGAPHFIGSVEARLGEPIAVPPPRRRNELIYARIFGLGSTRWEVLRNGLYRARERTVKLGGSGSWTLVPSTAVDGLILRLGAKADFPAPFALAPNVDKIELGVSGGGQRAVEVDFFAQRVRPLNPAGTSADSGA